MVLLIVDTQTMIMNEALYEFQLLESRIKTLIAQARRHGVEVVYVRHDDGAENALTKGAQGFDIYDEFKPLCGEKIVDKNVNSAFKDTGLTEYLRDKGEDTIMIAGLQTEYCINATIICGFEHGFHMIVPAYTNSTVDNDYMSAKKTYDYYINFIWKNRYASCVPFERALEMIKQNMLCR